jgi:hypothetical protein
MAVNKGKPQDFSDLADVSAPVALNSSTATNFLAANVRKVVLWVSNASNRDIWVRPIDELTDPTEKKGILIAADSSEEVLKGSEFTGPWSAIASSGTPDLHYTYW